jgi:hypothetical protein
MTIAGEIKLIHLLVASVVIAKEYYSKQTLSDCSDTFRRLDN